MVKVNDIVSAINQKLVELDPISTVYTNLLPKDFLRPSFFIEMTPEAPLSITDANRSTIAVTVGFTITCFVESDGHYNSDTSRIAERVDHVTEIFTEGYLQVGDRCLKVDITKGGVDFTESSISVVFDYFDDRPGVKAEHEPITNVQTNIDFT